MNRTPRRIRQSRYDELYAQKGEGLSTRAQVGQGILIVVSFVFLLVEALSAYIVYRRTSTEDEQLVPLMMYCSGVTIFLAFLLCLLALRGNAGARNFLGGLITVSGLRALAGGLLLVAFGKQLFPEFEAGLNFIITIYLVSGGLYSGLGLSTFTPMVNAYLDEV